MSGMNYVIKVLGDLIAPLGKDKLASLIVVLALNQFGKYSFAKKTKQKGGNIFNNLVSTVMPMSKDNLLTLASILLLDYFMKKNRSTSTKKRGGGKR